MRRQRSGHIFNLSSIGGMRGSAGGSLYAATKFAVEGFSESLSPEVAPFGISATIVEPGFFRTDFLDGSSVRYGQIEVGDYAEASAQRWAAFDDRSHRQAGDPAKLGAAIVDLASREKPRLRFAAGSDAVEIVADKIERLKAELKAWRPLSITTDSTEG
jgi:NAD(P)-dependent dehydrogenase (short-subunit alcohol dehydrogenase family)